MSMTGDIGKLLVALDNAVLTVFGDDAFITHLVPSPQYEEDGTILDVTITVNNRNISGDEYDIKMGIFDELIYNSVFHYENALLKVNISFRELYHGEL